VLTADAAGGESAAGAGESLRARTGIRDRGTEVQEQLRADELRRESAAAIAARFIQRCALVVCVMLAADARGQTGATQSQAPTPARTEIQTVKPTEDRTQAQIMAQRHADAVAEADRQAQRHADAVAEADRQAQSGDPHPTTMCGPPEGPNQERPCYAIDYGSLDDVLGVPKSQNNLGASGYVNGGTGSEVEGEEIEALPSDGRRATDAVRLMPGASEDEGGAISFRGMAGGGNEIRVDGGEARQEFTGRMRGGASAAFALSQAAVQALHADSQNYDASYGGASGGLMLMETRRGVDRMHGAAWYLIRDNNLLAAMNPYATATGFDTVTGLASTVYVKPSDVRQQMGVRVSGPVKWSAVRGSLHSMDALEAQRRSYPGVATPQSPLFYELTANQMALMKNNRGLSGTQIANAMGYLSGLGGTVGRRGDEWNNLARVDWEMGSRHTLSADWNDMRWSSPAGAGQGATVARGAGSFGGNWSAVDAGQARWVYVMSRNVVNEVRAEWSRDLQYETAQQPLAQEPATGPGGFAPQITIGPDGFAFGSPESVGRTAWPDERRAGLSEALKVVHGRQVLEAGVEWSRVDETVSELRDAEGSYSYEPRLLLANGLGQPDGIADWITDFNFSANSYPSGGCPAVEGGALHYFCFRDYTQGFGPVTTKFHLLQWSGFAQDTWRVTARLTVIAGARYELEQMPEAQQPNAGIDAAFAGVGSTATLPTDGNNFAPRVGVAWDVTGSGRTVVRAGYGVFYGRVTGEVVRQALLDTAVLGADGMPASEFHVRITPTTEVVCGLGGTMACSCPQGSAGWGYPCAFTSYPAGVAAVADTKQAMMFAKGFQLPMVQEGSLGVEQELGGVTLTATYAMSLSRELPNSVDANIEPSTGMGEFVSQGGPLDGQSFWLPVYQSRVDASYGPVTEILSNVNGTYNAVTLGVRRRLRDGWAVNAHWTWAKAIDDGTGVEGAVPENAQMDPREVLYDKGLSGENVPHRGVASVVWMPPGVAGAEWRRAMVNGWELGAVFTEQSGRAYSYGVRGGTYLNGGRQSLNGAGGATYLPSVGRNTLRMPDTATLDMRLGRRWKIGKGATVRASAEAFNLMNRVNVSRVNTTAYDVGQTTGGVTQLVFQSAAVNPVTPFGAATGASMPLAKERQVQVGIRVEY